MSGNVALSIEVAPYHLPAPHSGSLITCPTVGLEGNSSTLQDLLSRISDQACANIRECGFPLSYTAKFFANMGNYLQRVRIFAATGTTPPFDCYPPQSVKATNHMWNITINSNQTHIGINDITVKAGDTISLVLNT